MIVLAVHFDQLGLEVDADPGKDGAEPADGIAVKDFAAVFRHKNQVDMHLENTVPPVSNVIVFYHRPTIL